MEGVSVNQVKHGGLGALPLFPQHRAPAEKGAEEAPARSAGEAATPVESSRANPASAPVGPQAVKPVDRALLEQTTRDLNVLASASRGIRFQVAPEGEGFVVQVVDLETDEVIRGIPPEQILSLRNHFEELRDLLVDDRA